MLKSHFLQVFPNCYNWTPQSIGPDFQKCWADILLEMFSFGRKLSNITSLKKNWIVHIWDLATKVAAHLKSCQILIKHDVVIWALNTAAVRNCFFIREQPFTAKKVTLYPFTMAFNTSEAAVGDDDPDLSRILSDLTRSWSCPRYSLLQSKYWIKIYFYQLKVKTV